MFLSRAFSKEVDPATPRYCFVLPDVRNPVGGQNVLYEMAEVLHEAGYDVAIVHGRKHYRYPFFESSVYRCYNPRQHRLNLRKPHLFLSHVLNLWVEWQSGHVNERLAPKPGDIMVVPEFYYPEYAQKYPNLPVILVAQDVFGFLRAHARHVLGTRMDLLEFRAIMTTSEASKAAISTILGQTSHEVRLAIDNESLIPQGPKKKQIAYMLRKRGEEARLIVALLNRRPALRGMDFVPIQNVSSEERNRILRESLIFLSFSQTEGFGLPPAEAMAAECIVIGYTGVGGNEYFTEDRGFPVADSDAITFIRTVEKVVAEYQSSPERLDYMRREAAKYIRSTYTRAAFRNTLLAVWKDVNEQVSVDNGSL